METRAHQTLGDWFRERRSALAALVAFAVVIVLRAPGLLFPGRFWAEDGTVFFLHAWTHSFVNALLAPHQGYYSLWPNVAGIAAAKVPLLWAPRVTSFFGLLAQCSPAAVILFTIIPGLERPILKVLALLILLFVPADTEVYLNAANSHFLLCAATGLILISQHDGPVDRWGKWLFLGIVALTGVVSIFLTPFFFWQWWLERRRERLIQALILSIGVVVQVVAMRVAAGQMEREVSLSPTLAAGAFYAKLVIAPVTSYGNYNHLMEPFRKMIANGEALPFFVWATVAGAGAVFVWLCVASRSRTALLLAGAGIWVALLSMAGTLGTDFFDRMCFSPRYFYAPQVFCALAVLVALAEGKLLPFSMKAVSTAWLALFFCMGLFNFVSGPAYLKDVFSGPAWQPQVERWETDSSAKLVAWPDRTMTLPKSDR